MIDFEIQRCTRRCAKTQREFKPGEPFYSVLVPDGAEIRRHDYSAEAWDGPPEDAVGWWKSQMPDANAHKMHWAPNDVMLHYFQQLEGQPGKEDIRYVLALLMIRRRIVRLEATETDPQGREIMVLYCPRGEVEYRVPVTAPAGPRVDEIQQELAALLFADAS